VSSIEHPQINDKVKIGNKIILKKLKNKLKQAKSLWLKRHQAFFGVIIIPSIIYEEKFFLNRIQIELYDSY